MSFRNGDRSRAHRLRRQKLHRRQVVAAVLAERQAAKPSKPAKSAKKA